MVENLGAYPNFWIDFSEPGLNDQNYTGDGVDRRRWKFDEDGFGQASNAALLAARQQLQDRIRTINQDIVDVLHPNDFDVTVDGVPVDKAKMRT